MSSYLRPDEKAALSDIERSKSQDDRAKSVIKTAIGIGSAAIGGGMAAKGLGPLSSKILPFLNRFIPASLALAGISKISPEIGKFLKNGMDQGLKLEDGLDHIKSEIERDQQSTKEDRNIIQQYSPELHDFLSEKVRSGISPVQAGAIAQSDKRFSSIIKKMSKDHKTPWSNILESVFGQETSRRDTLKKFNENIRKPGVMEQETERFENQYGQQQQGQDLPPEVVQILQGVREEMQRLRGI